MLPPLCTSHLIYLDRNFICPLGTDSDLTSHPASPSMNLQLSLLLPPQHQEAQNICPNIQMWSRCRSDQRDSESDIEIFSLPVLLHNLSSRDSESVLQPLHYSSHKEASGYSFYQVQRALCGTCLVLYRVSLIQLQIKVFLAEASYQSSSIYSSPGSCSLFCLTLDISEGSAE